MRSEKPTDAAQMAGSGISFLMIGEYPLLHLQESPSHRVVRVPGLPARRAAGTSGGSWHYHGDTRSRRLRMALALLLSAAFHAGLFLGIRSQPKVVEKSLDEQLIKVTIAMPDLKDLEPPEPPPMDDNAEVVDFAQYVPTLMDAPQIALPSSFVQEINYASLIPPPDTSQAKILVIPQGIGSGRLGAGLADIFNLIDLDRVPVPVLQPSPVFPFELKREVSYAEVNIEFIVDVDGRVRNPVAVKSSHPGFINAAIAGVEKWRFRPGMKGGKRVNTRMMVPIIFRLTDADN